jgi:hypothetical protein
MFTCHVAQCNHETNDCNTCTRSIRLERTKQVFKKEGRLLHYVFGAWCDNTRRHAEKTLCNQPAKGSHYDKWQSVVGVARQITILLPEIIACNLLSLRRLLSDLILRVRKHCLECGMSVTDTRPKSERTFNANLSEHMPPHTWNCIRCAFAWSQQSN